jgi:hypothetical protein
MKHTNRRRITLVTILFLAGIGVNLAQSPSTSPADGPATQGVGLIRNAPGAFQGYTLLSPLSSTATYLIDMNGKVVKTWDAGATPSSIAYLLENGNLVRASVQANSPYGGGVAGGGGKIQEFDWNGNLVWDFTYSSPTALPHHDFTRLPNGNVLLVVQQKKTAAEAIAAGRIPSSVEGGDVRPDSLIEIKPNGKTGGDVVWEWHVWDHLIQDQDKEKANFGDVAANPGRVDINYNVVAGRRANADWTHFNAVAYNADLDQVVVSLRNFGEIWIIDHSTTTAQAKGKTGGRSGKGGDLLYRWGNPRVYKAGKDSDQTLFGQHNIHWIPKGLAGAGHLLVFNNGDTRPSGRFSTVDEIVLPVDSNGRYTLGPGNKYGPEKAVWSYAAPTPTDFYSSNISGAMRLPNGNTLICSGAPGIVFEVTPQNKVVWQFNLPSFQAAGGRGGAAAPAAGAGRGGAAAPGAGAGRGAGGGAGAGAGRGAGGGQGGAGARGAARGQGAAGARAGAAGPGAAPGGQAAGGAGAAAGRGAPAGGAQGRNVFRALRYPPDFPGFAGKQLVAGKTLEETVTSR